MRPLSTKIRASLLEKGACLVGYADVSDVVFEAVASLENSIRQSFVRSRKAQRKGTTKSITGPITYWQTCATIPWISSYHKDIKLSRSSLL